MTAEELTAIAGCLTPLRRQRHVEPTGMPLARLFSTAILLIALPGFAQASPTFVTERVVGAGRTQKIGYFAAIDPTCHSMGQMTINLLDEPHGGRIQVMQGREYPSFATFNTRSSCNKSKLPATQLFYAAAPGYTGEDEFTIEVVGPLGAAQRWRYRVTVR